MGWENGVYSGLLLSSLLLGFIRLTPFDVRSDRFMILAFSSLFLKQAAGWILFGFDRLIELDNDSHGVLLVRYFISYW